MKKITLLTATFVLFAFMGVDAQETLKPSSGDFTVEVDFRPLSASPVALTHFKGRYFVSNNLVVRAGVNIYFKNQKDEPNEGKDESKQSTFLFGVYPGIEKHFGDMKRLSPYIGGELGLAFKTSTDTYTSNSGSSVSETVYRGAWSDGSQRGFFSLGLNLIIGTDYYISKKLFMGIEMGFGFQNIVDSEVSVEQTGQSDATIANSASTTEIGINFNSAIRLGYSF